jgi:hypothetical protein
MGEAYVGGAGCRRRYLLQRARWVHVQLAGLGSIPLGPDGSAKRQQTIAHFDDTARSMTKLQVRLGSQATRFAQPQPGLELLGTVQAGPAIGALARLADGRYAQVNGDVIRVLSGSRVAHAIRLSPGRPAPTASPLADAGKPAVVVIKKKRRMVAPQAT